MGAEWHVNFSDAYVNCSEVGWNTVGTKTVPIFLILLFLPLTIQGLCSMWLASFDTTCTL
jgi:hypothetical protein